MRRLCLATICTLLLAASAFAQSSGNFNAAGTNAACGIDTGGKFNGGNAVTLLTTYVKTSNGNGVTLDIRPNLVSSLRRALPADQQSIVLCPHGMRPHHHHRRLSDEC